MRVGQPLAHLVAKADEHEALPSTGTAELRARGDVDLAQVAELLKLLQLVRVRVRVGVGVRGEGEGEGEGWCIWALESSWLCQCAQLPARVGLCTP